MSTLTIESKSTGSLSLRRLLTSHPILSYFALTFATAIDFSAVESLAHCST